MKLLVIGLAGVIALWAFSRFDMQCEHHLIEGWDNTRGWHRKCLYCRYRSNGLKERTRWQRWFGGTAS